MLSTVSTFSSTVQKSEAWIKELQEELNWMTNDQVYHVLRAVLQTLRDHLSTDEAAQFAAQLPLLLRGTFFECWNPKAVPEKRASIESFFSMVLAKMAPVNYPNFDVEQAVRAAIKVIRQHVSSGEINDVTSSLNSSLKTLLQ